MVQFDSSRLPEGGCVTLIGMAGAGKSTLGRLLARAIGWAQLDTDQLLEAFFGTRLQDVFDTLGREAFVAAEELVVARLRVAHCVVSTGGSVIYGDEAVAQLKRLGPVVFLRAGLDAISARVGAGRDRGLAIAPGQTVQDLYAERLPLYEAAADFTVDTDTNTPQQAADAVLAWLRGEA
ncbi:homoserine kinase [uncultured Cohaesibacter sp.]|uniref:homoserine kinase n=1 Tax=uncultured Cohaesibacter sp. TaxID=1002546 RepID=UPI0029C6E2C6|nr:homoserine kinase [uncultured Cohaesibacter sp.]